MEKQGMRKFGALLKRLAVPILVLVFVASLAANAYLFHQTKNLKADPQRQAQADVERLLTEVGQVIVLPTGETPTVATVSDPSKLSSQPFFANAKTGDKVLLYTNAKKAFLYDPTARKIVEVAPINIGSTPTPTPAPEVAGETTENTTPETQP